MVGDGKNGEVGPSQAALSPFYGRQVIPICTGWFREMGEDLEKIIKLLVREASSGDDWISISPLVNTDRKGGTYHIMLQKIK